MLRIRGLVKSYPSPGGDPVRPIDGLSVDVAAGEMVALYGPSGSGKSTLLLLIAGVLEPEAGELLVDGQDLFAMTPRERADYQRLQIGYVRQVPTLLDGATALDNAMLKLLDRSTPRRQARRRAVPLLEELGLAHRLDHRVEDLSVGERQRVAIASALATEPMLVLADEPTGSLDRRRSTEILELFAHLCHERNVATVLASHDEHAKEIATTAYALEDGRLVSLDPVCTARGE